MQSVLAVPFVIPSAAEAAGDFAPSTDGAFLQSFADALPDQAGIEGTDIDPTGLGIVQALAVPLALLPGGAVPLGQHDLAVPTEASVERARAGSLAASVDGGGPSTAVADLALSGGDAPDAGSGAWPLSSAPLTGLQTLGALDLSLGPHTGTADPLQAIAADARPGRGVPGEDARALHQPRAGLTDEADALADQPGFSTPPEVAAVSHVPKSARGPVAPLIGANDGGLSVPPPAGKAGHEPSTSQPSDGPRSDADLGQLAESIKVDPRVVATKAVPAVPETGVAKSPLPHGGGQGETSADPLPAHASTPSGGDDSVSHFSPQGRPFVTDDWVSGPAWAATRGNAAGGPFGDPVSLPGSAEGAPPERPSASPPTPAAGFWEQLLTGLSAGLPADQVAGDPADRAVREADPDVGPDAEAASDVKAWAVTAPPAASDRAAASLAHFAKALALQADAATDPAPEKDMVDQFAASAAVLPGLLAQGQALPHSSPAGLTQLPVPHVAAQISAALTQSADGSTELALSPEELGNVRLRLERDAKHPDRMVVHITFERPETLDLFRRHAGELAEALRDAGFAGADIGFGQQEGGAGTPDRKHGAATPDYGSALIEAQPPEPRAPRLMAGASLDLRL